MRADHTFHIFAKHYDWYTFDKVKGYIPTEKAPKEAVDAMNKYNAINFIYYNK